MDSNHRSRKTADLQSAPFGHSGIRPKIIEPMEGFEPTTPRLQITCSGQLSYIGKIAPIDIIVNPMRNGCKFSDKF